MRIFYELIYTVPFALFLISYFFLSQKIYIYNKFLLAFLIVIAVTVLIFFFCYKKDYNKVILFAAIPSFYILLLWLIKKKYQIANNFFIKKNWIKKDYLNKDFTWVELNDTGDDIWDNKIATKPSLLDYILTLMLLFAPMPLALGLSALTSFLF